MGQSRILCKHHKGANRAKTQRERREAVPFGVILAAKAPHVKVPPAQSGIRSAKYTASWAWITLQSCRRPVHFLVMSIIARYSIFSRLSSVGKTDLAFVTFRSCRLKPSIALSYRSAAGPPGDT